MAARFRLGALLRRLVWQVRNNSSIDRNSLSLSAEQRGKPCATARKSGRRSRSTCVIAAACPRWDQYELLFQRRLTDSGIRVPRGFEDNFIDPSTPQQRRIKALIDEHRAQLTTKCEQQKKRLADAQRSLKTAETKAARESERIATNKVQSLTDRLADLRRTEPRSGDARIYPLCMVSIKEENVDAWLTPEGPSTSELRAILDDVERPYYAHEVLAPESNVSKDIQRRCSLDARDIYSQVGEP
jgi:hypothetical protein